MNLIYSKVGLLLNKLQFPSKIFSYSLGTTTNLNEVLTYLKSFIMNKTTFKSKNLKFYCFIIFISFLNFNLKAQDIKSAKNDLEKILINKSDYFKIISSNEKIYFGDIESNASWSIIKKDGSEFYNTNLFGNEINSYVFDKSGIYEIDFNENKIFDKDACNHQIFPKKMLVAVSPVSMKFDLNKVAISETIVVGQNTDGIIVAVPVMITNNSQGFMFALPNITLTGVGVNVVGMPVNKEIKIENGIQMVSYKLSGLIFKPTMLMFDFVDINNQIQSYTYSEIIK